MPGLIIFALPQRLVALAAADGGDNLRLLFLHQLLEDGLRLLLDPEWPLAASRSMMRCQRPATRKVSTWRGQVKDMIFSGNGK